MRVLITNAASRIEGRKMRGGIGRSASKGNNEDNEDL